MLFRLEVVFETPTKADGFLGDFPKALKTSMSTALFRCPRPSPSDLIRAFETASMTKFQLILVNFSLFIAIYYSQLANIED